jgi:hypothetical protein
MLVLRLDHPFGPTFLPQLDGCLASARPHAGESKLERGDLIEIAGPSGSGMPYDILYARNRSIG